LRFHPKSWGFLHEHKIWGNFSDEWMMLRVRISCFFLGKGYPYDSSKTRRLRFLTNLSSDDVQHVQLEAKCKRIQPAEFVWWGKSPKFPMKLPFLGYTGIPLMEKNTISRHTSHESREIKTPPMILRVSSTNLWLSVNLLTQVQTIAMSFLVSFPAPLFKRF
jgi:hypothetical protein